MVRCFVLYRGRLLAGLMPRPRGTSKCALGVLAELVCAFLMVAGAATRMACVPLLITMLVAAFVVHGGDPFKEKKLALPYAAGTFTLMFTGAGKDSINALRKSREDS